MLTINTVDDVSVELTFAFWVSNNGKVPLLGEIWCKIVDLLLKTFGN